LNCPPPPCKLLLCISPVVQNALICIYYARFQVPVPGSGSCIAVSLFNSSSQSERLKISSVELMTSTQKKRLRHVTIRLKWKTGSFRFIAKTNSQARCEYFRPITMLDSLF
jgi:hypothetical protein